MEQTDTSSRRLRLFRWGDAAVILAVLLLAGASFFLLFAGAQPGSQAVITTPEGEITWDLSQDHSWKITGRDGIPVTIEASGGRIRFQTSGCPDQICVHQGYINEKGGMITCLPNRVVIQAVGTDTLDGVS